MFWKWVPNDLEDETGECEVWEVVVSRQARTEGECMLESIGISEIRVGLKCIVVMLIYVIRQTFS